MKENKPFSSIRTAENSDFGFIYDLYFHPDINPYLLYEPMSEIDFRPIFEDLLAKKCLFIFESAEGAVGMFKLYGLTHRCAHIAYLGGVAVRPEAKGRGWGAAMLRAIVDKARLDGFKRIELSVATHNETAIKAYKSVGFESEGVLRAYTHLVSEGRYIDELLMAVVF